MLRLLTRLAALAGMLIVAASARPAAAQTLSVNGEVPPAPITVRAGSVVSVAVSGGPGNPTDWIGLYPAGAADGSYADWWYLSGTTTPPGAGLTDATVAFALPASPGTYELRLFASNGYQRLASSASIVLVSTAQITVNGTAPLGVVHTVPGSTVSVAVADGPANTTDWVGLFVAGSPDTAYLDWRYLNGTTTPPATGTPTGAISFLTPNTAGNYEVRLFAHNAFDRLAISTTIVVDASPAQVTVNGVASPSTVTVTVGERLSVGVSTGPANATDWIGLYPAGAADGAYLAWQYLNGSTSPPSTGTAAAALTFDVPTSAGTYEFRLFANNGFVRLATSGAVVATPSPALLTVNGIAPPDDVTAVAGTIATVAVTEGPGNAADWVGLYAVGAADGAYLTWQYLDGGTAVPATGLSAAVLHFVVPTAGGLRGPAFSDHYGSEPAAVITARRAYSLGLSPLRAR